MEPVYNIRGVISFEYTLEIGSGSVKGGEEEEDTGRVRDEFEVKMRASGRCQWWMSRSKDGKDTGAERGMQPEKPRDANEVCQKEVDLEMISCSGSTRIKEMKRERT